jgi:hypothetical protein
MTTQQMKNALLKMTTGGKIILVTGDRGGGKTHLTMVLADFFLHQGGHVLSNVISYQKSTGTKWDDKEGYPPNYLKVTTLAQIFLKLSEIWHVNPEARVLIILDEAAVSLDAMSFQQFLAREIVKVATLIRKFSAALILISIRPELVLKKLRSEEGLLDVRIAKEPYLMRKYAGDLLHDKYDPKQIALIEWSEMGIDFLPIIVPMTRRLALSREYCETNGYYFDTLGAASFDSGKHPVTGKDFQFRELVAVLGAKPSNLYPTLLYRFMHEDPAALIAASIAGRSDGVLEEQYGEDNIGGPEHGSAGNLSMHKKRHLVELLRDYGTRTNADLARECGVSREYVRQVRNECRTKGIDVVLDELERQDRMPQALE